ncbi:MAG: YfhO family protein [Acidobacteriota bacterium]
MNPGIHSRIARHAPPVLLALGCALLVFRPWHGVFYYRDITLCQYPLFFVLKELWLADLLPLWDPYHAMGQPLLANPIFMSTYPLTQLLRVMHPHAYMNLFIPFHWLLAVCGLYALLCSFGLDRASAVMGAHLFGLSGPAVSATVQPLLIMPLAYVPWLLYFGRRAVVFRARWSLIAAALCLAAVITAGELATVLAATVLLVVVTLAGGKGTRWRALAPLATVLFLAVLLAGLQLVPALELARESGRTAGFAYERLSAHSLPPARLIEMLVPGAFGDALSASPLYYAGYRLFGEAPYLPSVFVGGVVLLVLLFYSVRSGTALRLPLLLTGLFFLVLALGKYGLLHRVLVSLLPPARMIRFPEKFVIFSALALAILAAHGIAGLVHSSSKRSNAVLIVLLAVTAVANVVIPWHYWKQGLVFSTIPLGLLVCARVTSRRSFAWAGLAALLCLMLYHAGGLNPKADFFPQENAVAQESGRAAVARLDDPAGLRLTTPDDSVLWGTLWDRETLNYATASEFGLSTPFERDVAAAYTIRQRQLHDTAQSISFQDLSRLARIYSCPWIIAQRIDATQVDSARILPTRAAAYSPPLFLARLRGDVQKAVDLRLAVGVPAAFGPALRQLLAGDFDWQRYAVLDGRVAREEATASGPLGTVESESGTRDDREFVVRLSGAGLVVVNESYYPGWKATVDGASVPVHRANGLVMAVPVGVGEHRLRLRFQPRSLQVGLAMVLLGVVVACWICRPRRLSSHQTP